MICDIIMQQRTFPKMRIGLSDCSLEHRLSRMQGHYTKQILRDV